MSKLVGTYDPITHEDLGLAALTATPVKKASPYRNWLTMNLLAATIMKTCKRGDDFRMFFAFVERLGYGNKATMPLKEIAEDLGMSVSQVSSALKRLEYAQVIQEDKAAETKFKTYKLHAGLAWRGKSKDFPPDYVPWPKGVPYVSPPPKPKDTPPSPLTPERE